MLNLKCDYSALKKIKFSEVFKPISINKIKESYLMYDNIL
jgi:hypothetical protein